MDDGRFDALTKVLGAARTRRGAIGALTALFGGAAVAAAESADASKNKHHHHHKKRCNPGCSSEQTCDRKTRSCFCKNGGTVCGANCCLPGTTCESGQCTPLVPTPTCHEFGAACAGDNIPCCGSDLQCASGQGGKFDVACYKKVDVACTADTECVYGTRCTGGTCTLIQPPPVPTCTSSNCTGCCTGNVCIPIDDQTDNLCGSPSGICVTCDFDQECRAGTCIPYVCDGINCPDGCCLGNTCVPYEDQSDAICGTAGGACDSCPTLNPTCNTDTGVCEVAGTCGIGNCATGCCSGNRCVPYADQGADACGTTGAVCTPCASPLTCATGICA